MDPRAHPMPMRSSSHAPHGGDADRWDGELPVRMHRTVRDLWGNDLPEIHTGWGVNDLSRTRF
jgi:hypothetical protein